jgi:serine-type D-Ala-D-Ala carboxypeptidase/endopeptidase
MNTYQSPIPFTTLAVSWLFAVSCAHVEAIPRARSDGTSLDAQIKPEIDRLLLPLLEQQRLVGAVVGIVTPEATATWGYGSIERGQTRAPNGRTVFEIGSVTKVFTALLLSLAVERGAMNLDDPVADAAPDLAPALEFEGRGIRWIDLATHTSGLPRIPANLDLGGLNPYGGYGEKELKEFLATRPLKRRPGTMYEYSNLGSGLLGYLLQRIEGLPWDVQIRRSITQPLALRDTTVILDADQRSRFAGGYFYDDKTGLEEVPPWSFDALAGAGALRSTCDDLARFIAASMDLHATPLAHALAAMQVDRAQAEAPEMRMALGWHIVAVDEHPIFWKDGGTYGAYAFVAFVPSKRVGLVILSNTFSLDTPLATVGLKMAGILRKR